jgi:hypothetical protein
LQAKPVSVKQPLTGYQARLGKWAQTYLTLLAKAQRFKVKHSAQPVKHGRLATWVKPMR